MKNFSFFLIFLNDFCFFALFLSVFEEFRIQNSVDRIRNPADGGKFFKRTFFVEFGNKKDIIFVVMSSRGKNYG